MTARLLLWLALALSVLVGCGGGGNDPAADAEIDELVAVFAECVAAVG